MTRKTLTTGLLLTLALTACSEGADDSMMFGDDAGMLGEGDEDLDADEDEDFEDDEDEDVDEDEDPMDEDPQDEDPQDEDPQDEDPMDPEEPVDPEDPEEPVDPEDPEDPQYPEAEADGDSQIAPAVLVRFRNTAPAPISVDEPIFNEDPIQTTGLQYSNAISVPGDDTDVLQFEIVPGQVDPYVGFTLECDQDEPGRVRADIHGPEGLIDTIHCGDEDINVLLPDASSNDDYQVEIHMTEGDPLYVNYTLSINAFCHQSCNYSPYAG